MPGHHESCSCGECGFLPLFAKPEPKHVLGSETSLAAARSVVRPVAFMRAAVLRFIENEGSRGATDEEIALAMGMNPSSSRPRRIELVESGNVRDSGTFRPGRSGRQMTVWVAVTA